MQEVRHNVGSVSSTTSKQRCSLFAIVLGTETQSSLQVYFSLSSLHPDAAPIRGTIAQTCLVLMNEASPHPSGRISLIQSFGPLSASHLALSLSSSLSLSSCGATASRALSLPSDLL